MKVKDLVLAANELNKLLFDPKNKEEGWIETAGGNLKKITQGIKEAAAIMEPDDVLTPATVRTLQDIDWSLDDYEKADQKKVQKNLQDMGIWLNEEEEEEVEEAEEVEEEEEEDEPVKKTPAKKSPAKKTPKAEPEPEEEEEEPEEEEEEEAPPVKKKAPAKKVSGEPSNKAQVYLAWKKGEKDSDKLYTLIDGRVKQATVKSWMKQWEKGNNLPAIATK